MVRNTLIILAMLLAVAASLPGQGHYAAVTGIVTDSGDAVMPGVKISIRNVETNLSRNVVTSESGDFTVTNLVPGHYELVAESAGFRSYRKTGIVLEVGQTLRDDILLEVGSVTEGLAVRYDEFRHRIALHGDGGGCGREPG